MIVACILAVAACGENGPGYSVRVVFTVSPADSNCHLQWEGFASDSTTRVDVTLLEMYADSVPFLVPIGPNPDFQFIFHGYTDIRWDGPSRGSSVEITGVWWRLWEDGTDLIADDTARIQGWPTCSSP